MVETIEVLKSGREKLLELELEGKWLFHGSENGEIEEFEPRQGYNYRNGIHEPDGEPAVFTSQKADYAILMALINKHNCPKGYASSAGTEKNDGEEKKFVLKLRKDALEQLNENSCGYVYVFEKDAFTKREDRSVEYKSVIPVKPVNKILVKKIDLPPYIQIYN